MTVQKLHQINVRKIFHNLKAVVSMFRPTYFRIFFGKKTINSIQYKGLMESNMFFLNTPSASSNIFKAVLAKVTLVLGNISKTLTLTLQI